MSKQTIFLSLCISVFSFFPNCMASENQQNEVAKVALINNDPQRDVRFKIWDNDAPNLGPVLAEAVCQKARLQRHFNVALQGTLQECRIKICDGATIRLPIKKVLELGVYHVQPGCPDTYLGHSNLGYRTAEGIKRILFEGDHFYLATPADAPRYAYEILDTNKIHGCE